MEIEKMGVGATRLNFDKQKTKRKTKSQTRNKQEIRRRVSVGNRKNQNAGIRSNDDRTVTPESGFDGVARVIFMLFRNIVEVQRRSRLFSERF